MAETLKFVGLMVMVTFAVGAAANYTAFAERWLGIAVGSLLATCVVILAVSVVEWLIKGKKSFLGGG